MTSANTVRYAVSEAVATITLDRPTAANALDRDLKESLLDALRTASSDGNVRAVLLTGSGKAFCVGQDLAEHEQALANDPATALDTVQEHYNPIVRTLAELPKPVVVGINGPCVGAGLGFALAGDIRVAADSAKFGTAFAGIGLASDSGLSASLVHAVGASRATELFFLGEMLPAQKALEWGLVHRVASAADLNSTAYELTEQLAQGPTAAYAEVKALLRSTDEFRGALEAEGRAQRRLARTVDHRDAVAAFMNKQQPEFRGK